MAARLLAAINLVLSLVLLAGGIVLLTRDDPDGGAHAAGWILVAAGSVLSLLTLFGVWGRMKRGLLIALPVGLLLLLVLAGWVVQGIVGH